MRFDRGNATSNIAAEIDAAAFTTVFATGSSRASANAREFHGAGVSRRLACPSSMLVIGRGRRFHANG
jgi:hypothetical protein